MISRKLRGWKRWPAISGGGWPSFPPWSFLEVLDLVVGQRFESWRFLEILHLVVCHCFESWSFLEILDLQRPWR